MSSMQADYRVSGVSEQAKYVVFRAGDPEPLEEGSYFVIRSSDIFASAGIYGYAHSIQSMLEVDALPGRRFLAPAEREYLEHMADVLFQVGLDWNQAAGRRIPD